MEKVLLAADDALQRQLRPSLLAGGFETETVMQSAALFQATQAANFAAVILRLGLPWLEGFESLRRVRTTTRLPILLLVEPANELDAIIGLELGADDYLLLPVNPRALLARLRSGLRRARPDSSGVLPPLPLVSGSLELNEQLRTVWRAGEKLALTAVEFDLLRAFLLAAGQPLAREELAQSILGRALHPADRSLDVHISKLRKKLGCAECIKALRNLGYVYTGLSTPATTELSEQRNPSY